MLNDDFQPVSDDDKLVSELSNFLGTIARQYVPLNWVTWHHVPDKNDMWEFVKEKYIIPEEGKHWVMQTIRDAWRVHKSRVKLHHYSRYENDEERLENRPKDIPLEEFKMLLHYWNDPDVQKIAERNATSRKKIKDTHTTGPRSFAQIKKKLQLSNPNHKTPTKAELFVETRKRKEGRRYKLSDDILKYRISTIEEIGSSGANNETIEQLMCGDTSHGSSWLVGRRGVPKKSKENSSTPVSNNYVDEMTKMKNQLVNEMDQKVKEQVQEQVRENMTWMMNKLGDLNPNLKIDIEKIYGDLPCENENAISSQDVAQEE